MSNLLEQLKNIGDTVEEISKMEKNERKIYLNELSKSFNKIQQSVYGIIDERGIILQNYEWNKKEYIKQSKKVNLETFIANLAKELSYQYGYSYEVLYEILYNKNISYSYDLITTHLNNFHNSYQLIYYTLVPK